MKQLILFLLIFLVAADQFVGGYTQLNDTSSKQYQNVVAFINSEFPQLSKWKVASIKMQVVNGINYEVALQDTNQTAFLNLHSTFSGDMTAISYTLNSQPHSIPLAQNHSNLITIGRKPNNRSAISPTSNKTTIKQANITSGLNSTVNDVFLISNPLILDNFFVGGYRPVPQDENSSYNQVWDQVTNKYPQLQGFQLIEVRRQVVAGLNYVFVAQSPAKDEIMVIKVFQSLSKTFEISILQTNTATGFSSDEILSFKNKCIEMNPNLSQYQLVYISNISDDSGLRLTFALESNYVTADCSYDNGKQVVVFQ